MKYHMLNGGNIKQDSLQVLSMKVWGRSSSVMPAGVDDNGSPQLSVHIIGNPLHPEIYMNPWFWTCRCL
uniref:Uncharacterized protein n=1 Tax=Arion vulgaris TaxID=1028688 RepID=A0A0B6ZA81_9EUPU